MTASREELIAALPYARRFARALTGAQATGDAMVADALREVLGAADPHANARVALYGAVTQGFLGKLASGQYALTVADSALDARQRALLLLTALEGAPLAIAAEAVGLSEQDAGPMLQRARDWLRKGAATQVLIIEDEPIIAMDIEELVRDCGHHVIGVAASESEAIALAARQRPGLILADINLGAGGDGAAAVARIMQSYAVPVIFVTAYPERLLTGAATEPAFVITKPFEPLTLAIATYQAVTGGVGLG